MTRCLVCDRPRPSPLFVLAALNGPRHRWVRIGNRAVMETACAPCETEYALFVPPTKSTAAAPRPSGLAAGGTAP